MADLSQLNNLKSTEPLDLPVYRAAGSAKPFPKAGRYTARVRESFPAEAFGESKAGYLTVDVAPTLLGGDNDGYQIRFVTLSAKTWIDKFTQAATSQIGRFLKACGQNDAVGGSPQETADAVERTANSIILIDVDWIARYGPTRYELKGMTNFPVVDGVPSRFVQLNGENGRPKVSDPVTGEPLTIRAFLEVTRFLENVN